MSEHLRLYTWHPTAVKSLKMRSCESVSTEVRNENSQKMIDEILRRSVLYQKKPAGKEEIKIVRNFMPVEMLRMLDGMFALTESFRAI
jgi:hypothetical protein